MYLEALLSPSTSEYTSSATTPAPWPASSPQNFGAAMQSPASFQSGASSFWPQIPSYNGEAIASILNPSNLLLHPFRLVGHHGQFHKREMVMGVWNRPEPYYSDYLQA